MKVTGIRKFVNNKFFENPPIDVQMAYALREMFPSYERHINSCNFSGSAYSQSKLDQLEEFRNLVEICQKTINDYNHSISVPMPDEVFCDDCKEDGPSHQYIGKAVYHCEKCNKDWVED